ncbi:hypothetical protein [Paraburkholderia sp. HP33-1]|uniref:hypothetical protein n=1 Tax=Paraburkholderia sp. HP33-1 TaxID=2883243 RepID=UPI001F4034C4|nr:hypothetical protein [Paraburkholderia sp. HP33-1]
MIGLLKFRLIVPCKHVANPLLSRQNIGGAFSPGLPKPLLKTGHAHEKKEANHG